MRRRYNPGYSILAIVVVLGLMLLMVCVDAQAQIAFMSKRDGNPEIYVMDADGGNPQNLTNNPRDDFSPTWFNSPFSVSLTGKKITIWGRVKQVDR